MRMSKAPLVLNTGENKLNSEVIKINSGIFQGVSLLCCVALILFTTLLTNTGYGYKIYDSNKTSLLYEQLETLCKD